MKRNKVLRTAAILLALVLLSTCAMTGTLAKYVQAFADQDSRLVRAGLFDVRLGNTLTVELTPTQTSGYDAYNDAAIIVPGLEVQLQGTFDIINNSEVDVDVVIPDDADALLSLEGFGTANIQFALDNSGVADTYVDLADTEDWTIQDLTGLATTAIPVAAQSQEDGIEITLWIKWIPDGDDSVASPDADTAVGLAQAAAMLEVDADGVVDTVDEAESLANIDITLPLIATQVDPS